MTERWKSAGRWKWWALGVLVLFVIGAASGGGSSDDGKSKTTASAATTATAPATTSTAASSAPAAAAKPAKRLSLSQRIKQDVIDINLSGEDVSKVETQPRGKRYDVLVTHAGADNVTSGLVQRSAELDAQRIMQNLYTGPERGRIQDVTVLATGPLIDKLGNESTGVTFSVTLPGATGRGINWDNIDSIDIRDLWTVEKDIIK